VQALGTIEHVKIIRVHSRLPVVAPSRVTPAMVGALKVPGKATFVVLHANHARELTAKARAACARLIDAGIPMLSQSVLLRGVNDDAAVLSELMRALVECRIKPYYLHHGDLAPGTAHWRTSIEEGQRLMRALRGHFSGLCQPTYVLDIPGGHGKSPIGPSYLARADRENGTACYEVEDFRGRRHAYPPVRGTTVPVSPGSPVDEAAIPVAREKPDPLASCPSEAGRRACSKPRAVDDEITTVRRLYDFDHVLLGRQIEPLIGASGRVFHAVRQCTRAQQRAQRER
jgi:hypothetical protein